MGKFEQDLMLAYYDASDGPRVVFFGYLNGPFDKLQELFRSLSLGRTPVEIHCEPFVRSFGGFRLTAFRAGSISQVGSGKPQGLRRIPSQGGPEFHWHRTAEGWDYLSELLGGLVRSPIPCHQYLTAYPNEDAIVVASKGEYSEEVIQRIGNETRT